MPSFLHEAPLELLRRNPSLAGMLLTGIPGVTVPTGGPASLAPGDVTASMPVELRADAVVLLRGATDKLAVVTEVQMSASAIKRKRRVWPAYLTQARAQHDCPAVLMVFCRDRAVARACAKPIPTGHPQFVLTPIVIGPDDVPDGQQGTAQAGAELGMMKAWAGGADLRDPAVQVRTLRLLAGLDPETLSTYTRIVLMAAPDKSSQRALEALMATVFKSEFLDQLDKLAKLEAELKARQTDVNARAAEVQARQTDVNARAAEVQARAAEVQAREAEVQALEAEVQALEAEVNARAAKGLARGEAVGEAVGRAQMILRVLAARGIETPAEIHDQVLDCSDIAQLDEWGAKAATAQSIGEVFVANGTS